MPQHTPAGASHAEPHPFDPAASIRWLRLLVVLSIAMPLCLYAIFGAVAFQGVRDEAGLRVSRSLRVAHEHASKVMAASETLQERVLALVNGHSPDELHLNQAALHAALQARVKDQPQVQAIWVLDPRGRPIASSRFMPVPAVDLSDREYFRFHQERRPGWYLSRPFRTRTTDEAVLSLSIAFEDERGQLGGVVNINLLASYFEEFYSNLAASEQGLVASLFKDDGAVYARWPAVQDGPGAASGQGTQASPDSPVLQRIRDGQDAAQFEGISTVDGQQRILAFQKVGAYPLYVGTGMNLTAVRNGLLRQLGMLLALGALPVAALFFAARMALRNARTALRTMDSLRHEIETRHRAEEALLQAQKLEALGRLTGGVAHDFNNALMVISNNLHLLKRTLPGAGTRQIESMARAVKSAANLTRQLLAFSRRQPLVTEDVVLQERLPPVRDLIAPVLGSRIQFQVEAEPATAAVSLDVAELELALLNLSINARDAMPEGGTLAIRARNAAEGEAGPGAPPMVAIEVADSGAGIAPELLDKVFEPFFTTKPVGHGTGLGLSQVYGMCQRAGGSVRISSTVGNGTVIRLFLPASTPVQAAGQAPTVAALGGLNKSLLLVEDNDEVAGSLVQVLESLGCRVKRVDGAAKARDLLDDGARPDLVLSDVVMPGAMDGVGLAQHIRESWPEQRLVLMTGYAEQLDRIKAMGFEVLPKPCTPEMLQAAVARFAR